jgi:hypothetical protein
LGDFDRVRPHASTSTPVYGVRHAVVERGFHGQLWFADQFTLSAARRPIENQQGNASDQ